MCLLFDNKKIDLKYMSNNNNIKEYMETDILAKNDENTIDTKSSENPNPKPNTKRKTKKTNVSVDESSNTCEKAVNVDAKKTYDDITSDNFTNDNISLYFGDCIIEMDKIADDSVDLILCDLPYGTTKCKWDTIIDLNELWKQYKRIIKKPTGVIVLFGQQPFTSMLISSNYDWFKYNLIWKKNKTTQFLLANYRPMKCTEDICVFSKGGAAAASRVTGNMTYNPQGLIPTNIKKKNSKERIGKMLNQVHHLGKNNKLISDSEYTQKFTNYPNELIEFDIEYDTVHETQKPVKLIEYLIKTYSNEGDTVLDNTMGSGTTGVGCINTGRKFIGIEKEEKYFKLSKGRILSHL